MLFTSIYMLHLFLLTAKVNGLDSSDSSMTLATSQSIYDIYLLLYMLLMFMLLIGLAQLPLMSLPILIWPPLSGNNGRISFQHSDGNAGSRSLKQRFGPSSVRLLSSCCLPLNLVTYLLFRMKYGLCTSDVQPEERNTRFFPVGDPAY